jgi:anti-sigma factor ChrR (cupin superfamily)
VTPAKVYRLDGRARSPGVLVTTWIVEQLARAHEPRMPAPLRAHLRQRLMAQVHVLADRATRTVRAADGEWRALAPGVDIKLLRHEHGADNMTAFIRMQPGSMLAAPVHTQTEECLIVEGEIFIGAHRLSALDMHVAAGGTAHAPVSSPRGALILVRAQAARSALV